MLMKLTIYFYNFYCGATNLGSVVIKNKPVFVAGVW